MTRITTERPDHLSSAQLAEDLRQTASAVRAGDAGATISDAAALTVAGHWQSPGLRGEAFAELASTGACDADDLVWAIDSERAGASTGLQARELDELRRWASANVASDPAVHADYPHEPGTLYDCLACEAECFCGDREREIECVYCAVTAELDRRSYTSPYGA